MPAAETDVVAAFREINEDLQDKTDVVEKCQSIINHLGLSARDLANEWEAHVLSRGNEDSSQTMLTLSSLSALEAALSKRTTSGAGNTATPAAGAGAKRPNPARSGPGSTPRHPPTFNASNLPASEAAMRKRLSMDGGALGSGAGGDAGLMSPPPGPANKRAAPSPASAPFMSPPNVAMPTPRQAQAGAGSGSGANLPRATPSGVSPGSLQSPPGGAATPGGTGAVPYRDRANSGQKVQELNPQLGARPAFQPSKRFGGARCDLGVLQGPSQDINLKGRYRFMYTTLEERARAQEKALLRVQADLVERANLGDVTPVGVPKQETVVVVGRVCCEAAEGRINKASVVLEGSRRDSGAFRVKLDLDQLPAFALFPGQVIAVEGVNSSGFKMVVRRIIEGIPRPFATTPADKLREYHHDSLYQGGAPLSVLVAAGPFTTTDSLEYEPLEDLMRVIAARKPDVAVLAGPFVDARHPKVASGETEIAGAAAEEGEEEPPAETVDFESLFKMRVSDLLERLYTSNPDLPTRIVLVPSLHDVFHDHVFPQPPLADRIPGGVPSPWFEEERIGDLGLPFASESDGPDRRVYCMSNPAIFTVNEVTVGISTNDILFHLSGDEVSSNVGNRLARLAAHLLQQQSFYPLFPPPADGQAQLDLRHADHWRMPITPDVLLLPSKLAPFAKDVGGSLCVNPGALTKATSAGTYALLTIHPIPPKRLDAMAGGPDANGPVAHGVASRTSIEILRI